MWECLRVSNSGAHHVTLITQNIFSKTKTLKQPTRRNYVLTFCGLPRYHTIGKKQVAAFLPFRPVTTHIGYSTMRTTHNPHLTDMKISFFCTHCGAHLKQGDHTKCRKALRRQQAAKEAAAALKHFKERTSDL